MNTEMELGQNCKVRLMSPDECLERAVELMHFIEPAFRRAAGEVDAPSAVRMCAMGQAYCFIGEGNGELSALLIALLTEYPLKKICDVLAYAGRARDFYWFNETLEDWARSQGAVEMRGYGKEGPMRLARKHGYEEVYRVYTKSLERKSA